MSIIETAHASTGMAAFAESGFMNLLPFAAIFFLFYFMLIRPQMKKQKETQEMLKALKKGDRVVTSGGIVGAIHKIDQENNVILMEIAPDIKIKVIRSMVVDLYKDSAKAAVTN